MHIPYIVESEFTSQLRINTEKAIDDISKNLEILKKEPFPVEFLDWISKKLGEFQEKRAALIASSGKHFKEWIIEINAKKIDLDLYQATRGCLIT